MRSFIVVAAAGCAAVSIGVWLTIVANSPSRIASISSTPALPAPISIWEMHNQAHLEFLPVQGIEDQTTVFVEAKR